MKKKLALTLLILLLLTIFLSACGDDDTASDDKNLVIYSNSLVDGRGDWLEEKAKEEGFDLDLVQVGGGELPSRLSAEKNNPVADIVFGLNTMGFENLKKQDTLEKYKPSWAGDIQEGLNDEEEYYHSLVKQAILLIYNKEEYDEDSAPQDWPNLWENEEFHNKYYLFPDLNGGTTRAVMSGILVRYKDENGELGISDEGWDAIDKYYNNGYIASEGEEFYALLAEGKTPFGQMWSSGLATREEQYGVESGFAKPEVGVPYVVEQIGIVKGTENMDAAKEFVDWFGSAEVQGEFAEKFYALPANEKAMDKAPDYIKKIDEAVKPQDIDWGFVSENIEKWVEKVELEIMP